MQRFYTIQWRERGRMKEKRITAYNVSDAMVHARSMKVWTCSSLVKVISQEGKIYYV